METRNFWMDYATRTRTFHEIIVEGMYSWPPDTSALAALEKLARTLVQNSLADNLGGFEEDDYVAELLCYAVDRLNKFDPEKCNAFGYFVTCMLGRLRDLRFKPQPKYPELKRKYQEFLKKSQIDKSAK